MYCGDSVTAIIGDVGSCWSRFGFAGDDKPTVVVESSVGVKGEQQQASTGANTKGRFILDSSLDIYQPELAIKCPFADGVVADWDLLEALWDHGFRELLPHVDGGMGAGGGREAKHKHGSGGGAASHTAAVLPASMSRKDYPVLLAESLYNVQPQRERLVETMFETFGVPALYMTKGAVLCAFAAGRATALVIDLGGGMTYVTPVHDGYALYRGVQKSALSGNMLTDQLTRAVEAAMRKQDCSSSSISPAFEFHRKKLRDGSFKITPKHLPLTHSSYRQRAIRAIVNDMKHRGCAVTVPTISGEPPEVKKYKFQLPDGNVVHLQNELRAVPELLFDPKPLYAAAGATAVLRQQQQQQQQQGSNASALRVRTGAGGGAGAGAGAGADASGGGSANASASARTVDEATTAEALKAANTSATSSPSSSGGGMAASSTPASLGAPLQTMARSSLLGVDVDIRADLCYNVVLAGGGSLLPGLPHRLHYEMAKIIPSAYKVRVLLSAPGDRLSNAWTGGSILAGLGSFQQLWMSRLEYDEEGAGLIEFKCP